MSSVYFVDTNFNVQIKLLENYKLLVDSLDGEVPQLKRSTPESSGYDLIACLDKEITIWPNEIRMIGTGIAIFINNPHWEAQIRPRSGKGSRGLVLGNLIGTIDSDYQGEIKMCMWNRSEAAIKILPGEAIAQLVFCPVAHPRFNIVDEFSSNSIRGTGGFGSTGG